MHVFRHEACFATDGHIAGDPGRYGLVLGGGTLKSRTSKNLSSEGPYPLIAPVQTTDHGRGACRSCRRCRPRNTQSGHCGPSFPSPVEELLADCMREPNCQQQMRSARSGSMPASQSTLRACVAAIFTRSPYMHFGCAMLARGEA